MCYLLIANWDISQESHANCDDRPREEGPRANPHHLRRTPENRWIFREDVAMTASGCCSHPLGSCVIPHFSCIEMKVGEIPLIFPHWATSAAGREGCGADLGDKDRRGP